LIKEEPKIEIKEIPLDPKQKSVNDLCAYVLYVFDQVGTEAEKEVAKIVVSRFGQANTSK